MRKFASALLFFSAYLAAPQSLIVTARVFDYAGVPSQILKGAETEASYVAQKAGFAVDWVDCSKWTACSTLLGPDDVVFLLRARPLTRNHNGRYLKAGEAWLGPFNTGVYAIVYYDQILRTAASEAATKQDLLGYVMAHELGHLMGLGHSRRGVMSGKWKAREMTLMTMRGLHFSVAESRQVRSEIVARSKSTKESADLPVATIQQK